jgi:signal recognition particle receptor subunit beta/predicted regulator of Ras-like GTPase activity (Roadblock/LC7/MglB family)
MAILHEATKEVICKLVYHGTGMCGKTTSLMFLNHQLPASQRGRFISLETPTERTLYFDFLPVITEARGFKFRYLLFTTPGQDYYEASRKLVLKGADGIVYVVDSQKERTAENLSALSLLEKNLVEMGQRPELLPTVIQYNKRDLPSAVALDEAEKKYNPKHLLSFPAVAKTGQGVYETFLTIAKMALTKLTTPEGESRMGDMFKTTVITGEDGIKLRTQLARLNADSGAKGSLLVDESSSLLATHGEIPSKDFETLGALLACNFTAAQELAFHMSGQGFTGIIQKGAKWNMTASRVDKRRFLVVLCDSSVDRRRLDNAINYARGALAAALMQIDRMSPSRLAQFGTVFTSVSRIAVANMGGV